MQHQLARTLQPTDPADTNALRTAQKNRDRNARPLLEKEPSLKLLMEYCQKTQVELQKQYTAASTGGWRCRLSYESEVRQIACQKIAPTMKAARAAAAVEMFQLLIQDAGAVG